LPKTLVLPTNSPKAIPTALKVLNRDGLIAFPTDTVYGLASRLNSSAAIEKLFMAKGRDFNKAIAVLIGDLEQIHQVCSHFPSSAMLLALKFWPGALTMVVTRQPSLPAILSPNETIGVRIPDYLFARQLLRAAGPLATTSANLSGLANPLSALDVLAQLDGRIDLILDGGSVPGGVPSTVVGCVTDEIQIFRQGAITEEEIRKTLSQP
jgi:L-threonylcarbamoyladenylate synthase